MKSLSVLSFVLILLFIAACNQGKTWEQVKQENSVESYEEFLNNNPATEHKDSILMLTKELEWQKNKRRYCSIAH
jgi:hypothetical protein